MELSSGDGGLASPWLLALMASGVFGGLYLMVRGFRGDREAARIGGTAPSRVSSLAVGEALVTGVVEPAELTLISPLQSASCVYYRARIDTDDDGLNSGYREERAVGFRLRDESGEMRVFPRGGRFDVPNRFSERDGMLGERPPGLDLRTGSAFGPGAADRDGQIAALLAVSGRAIETSAEPSHIGGGRRRYEEARIEPGDVVTVIGRAMPFDQLADPGAADVAGIGQVTSDDPEIAADLGAARAAGILEVDPEDAWGNAAIPGFGIGRPTRAPELDPAAHRPAIVPIDDARAALAARTFAIPPAELVIASDADVALIVSLGAPAAVEGRQRQAFLTGLLGAVLAIVSAVALAVVLTSTDGILVP